MSTVASANESLNPCKKDKEKRISIAYQRNSNLMSYVVFKDGMFLVGPGLAATLAG